MEGSEGEEMLKESIQSKNSIKKEKRRQEKKRSMEERGLFKAKTTTTNNNNNNNYNNNNDDNNNGEKKKRDKGAFKFKDFTVRHDLCGMKVGTDAVLLAGYASLSSTEPHDEVWEGNTEFKVDVHMNNNNTINNNNNNQNEPRRILEIGCGSGVITLLLANRYKNAVVDSIDIDNGAIKQCLFNIHSSASSLPSLQQRIRLFHCPAQEFLSPPLSLTTTSSSSSSSSLSIPLSTAGQEEETRGGGNYEDDKRSVEEKQVNLNTLFKYVAKEGEKEESEEERSQGIYDLIICAPPYFKSDESTDMILRMKNKRRVARHTHTLLMEELAEVVYKLLKKDTGKFQTIFSLPYPADVFQVAAPLKGLKCVEKVHVRDNPRAENPVRLMETYTAPKKGNLPAPNMEAPTTTTTSSGEEEGQATNAGQTTNAGLPIVARNFSIYTASYKEMPLMHRPYTHQYKFLVKDFCIHFLNK